MRLVVMLLTTKMKMTKVAMTRTKIMIFKDNSLGTDIIWQ